MGSVAECVWPRARPSNATISADVLRPVLASQESMLALPPSQWFLPSPIPMRGAQRGILLAPGFFTGESRRNPPAG